MSTRFDNQTIARVALLRWEEGRIVRAVKWYHDAIKVISICRISEIKSGDGPCFPFDEAKTLRGTQTRKPIASDSKRDDFSHPPRTGL